MPKLQKMTGSEKLLRAGFKVKSVVHFLKSLKGLGERLLPVFKTKVRYEMNQFVAAAIVSRTEIENEDISIIEQANRKLNVGSEYPSDIGQDSYFSFNRLVVLMNTTKPTRHGEARLLDSDEQIRKVILSKRAIGSLDEDNNTKFLDDLKSMFANDFKNKRIPYILCIFSHNIPCTDRSHKCAQIIERFARTHNTEVIVAYEEVFYNSDEKEALHIMNSNDKVYCLKLKESSTCSPPSKTKSSSQASAYHGKSADTTEGVKDSRNAKQTRKRKKDQSPSIPSEKKKRKSYNHDDRENPEDGDM